MAMNTEEAPAFRQTLPNSLFPFARPENSAVGAGVGPARSEQPAPETVASLLLHMPPPCVAGRFDRGNVNLA